MLWRKRVLGFWLICGIVIAGLFAKSEYRLQLMPFSGEVPYLYAYSDKGEGGSSEVLYQKYENDILRFGFALGDSLKYPYVGGGFHLGRDTSESSLPVSEAPCVDFTPYRKLTVEWQGENAQYTRLEFFTWDPVYSKAGDPESYQLLAFDIMVPNTMTRETFSLEQWNTPQWWREKYKAPAAGRKKHWNQVCMVEWAVPGTPATIRSGSVSIASLELSGPNPWPMVIWLCVFALSVLVWFTGRARWLKLREQARQEMLRKQELHSTLQSIPGEENLPPGDWDRLKALLLESYRNPDLTVEGVGRDLGMNTDKISSLLKKHTGLTFKPFLNQLRMEKARELLETTEEQITLIAESAGFNSPSHFNRVFKNQTGQTPSEYRRDKKDFAD